MSIGLRPLTLSDIAAWAELREEIERVDRTGEHFSADDLAEEMANPAVEVGKDFVGAFDTAGQMVGYFSILPRGAAGGHCTIDLQGSVLPARRAQGIGTLLVTGMVERATRARDERRADLPARLFVAGLSSDVAQAELLASVGMRGERWTFLMRTSMDALKPARPPPAGYRLRGYDASMADALRLAHNAAFLDHPDFTPWSAALWQQSVTESRSFRPEVSFVVSPDDSDEILAYLQTAEFEADLAATGRREAYIGKVGTLRAHRGKGLATALLGHALSAYREAGYDEASLAVDSENPTGALGVYQRVGFSVESRWTNYAMTVDAPVSS
ncbi:MAG TPA: GNAT family N-acetyltransferase [Actinomycetes bacterium]|nr:GNAT family N-acetyltransferase [Actinomycetes bacterium]